MAEDKCKYADNYKAKHRPKCQCLCCRDKYIERLERNRDKAMVCVDSALQGLYRNMICPRQMLEGCMKALRGRYDER